MNLQEPLILMYEKNEPPRRFIEGCLTKQTANTINRSVDIPQCFLSLLN